MKEPSFTLSEFRKWITTHSKETGIFLGGGSSIKQGDQVLVRLSEENMLKKLLPLNEDKKNIIREICRNLKANGGILKKIREGNAEILVSEINESLIVPRLFLRKPRKKE
jgi:hypothetical protein